jgi:ubiquitin fusion degradation protein 1
MNTLLLEPGDLIQIKSTDLPPGRFVKLQPQSPSFLEISDPRAVLENAFRSFACLTKGDIFTFSYNDQTYDIAVLEIKPDTDQHAIVTMETDLEVDFATPVGYEPPTRTSGTSTPRTGAGHPPGGSVHFQGTMAQSINYAAIAPNSQAAAAGAKAVSSNFLLGGQKLKGSKAPTPKASTPVAGASTNPEKPPPARRTNGPQPLRLPPGKLFFGYEIKPLQKKKKPNAEDGDEQVPDDDDDAEEKKKPRFPGQGQKLRPTRRDEGSSASATGSAAGSDVEGKAKASRKAKEDQHLARALGRKGK